MEDFHTVAIWANGVKLPYCEKWFFMITRATFYVLDLGLLNLPIFIIIPISQVHFINYGNNIYTTCWTCWMTSKIKLYIINMVPSSGSGVFIWRTFTLFMEICDIVFLAHQEVIHWAQLNTLVQWYQPWQGVYTFFLFMYNVLFWFMYYPWICSLIKM